MTLTCSKVPGNMNGQYRIHLLIGTPLYSSWTSSWTRCGLGKLYPAGCAVLLRARRVRQNTNNEYKHTAILHTYLTAYAHTKSPLPLERHRASIIALHRTLLFAICLASPQVLPILSSSLVTVRLHDCLGLPLFLLPWGFNSMAILVVFPLSFLVVWPIHFHFLCFIIYRGCYILLICSCP